MVVGLWMCIDLGSPAVIAVRGWGRGGSIRPARGRMRPWHPSRDDLTRVTCLSAALFHGFPFTPIDLGSLVAFDVRGWCHCQAWISPYGDRIDDLAEAWVDSELEHGCHSLAFIYGVAAVALPFQAHFLVLMVSLQYYNIRRCHRIQLDRDSTVIHFFFFFLNSLDYRATSNLTTKTHGQGTSLTYLRSDATYGSKNK